jgi:23S rRNA (adenine2503-C2)-methyltransferase
LPIAPTEPLPRRDAKERPLVARLPDELTELLAELGEPSFRADQIFRWIHQRGVFDVDQMTNLSRGLRSELKQRGLECPVSEELVQRSSDGTRKLLLRLADGLAIECVLIPRKPTSEEDDDSLEDELAAAEDEIGAPEDMPGRPVTLCVSSQVGCAMGCVFCASGQAGLRRGLGAHEIVAQVALARRQLDPGERLTNIVYMGMGEPLHHYAETSRSIRLLTHPLGRGMSPRRITVSTVGLISGIRKLGEDFGGKIGLAISLHAPDTETRSRIVPMNENQPMSELIAALKKYPLPKRRRITIEYTLIGGVNDEVRHARGLAQTLRGMPVKVNLIPMNPIAASELRGPSQQAVEEFRMELGRLRVSCSVRQTRGDDVNAACGQLALAAAPPGN